MFGDIVKMTQVSAPARDEAEGLEALGIDLTTIADLDIDEIRDGAPNTFVNSCPRDTEVRPVARSG